MRKLKAFKLGPGPVKKFVAAPNDDTATAAYVDRCNEVFADCFNGVARDIDLFADDPDCRARAPAIAYTVSEKAGLQHALALMATRLKATRDIWGPEISAIKREIEELKARPTLQYEGVWEAGKRYLPGAMVTDNGSIWHCNTETVKQRPGDGPAWTLAVKRGRDGKDAK